MEDPQLGMKMLIFFNTSSFLSRGSPIPIMRTFESIQNASDKKKNSLLDLSGSRVLGNYTLITKSLKSFANPKKLRETDLRAAAEQTRREKINVPLTHGIPTLPHNRLLAKTRTGQEIKNRQLAAMSSFEKSLLLQKS